MQCGRIMIIVCVKCSSTYHFPFENTWKILCIYLFSSHRKTLLPIWMSNSLMAHFKNSSKFSRNMCHYSFPHLSQCSTDSYSTFFFAVIRGLIAQTCASTVLTCRIQCQLKAVLIYTGSKIDTEIIIVLLQMK